MEKAGDVETKYQKLATEYSKIRSQATVLKKAVLDEQAKNLELKDVIKKHEQQIRKHDQEMESLTFRNEQLTKRITVLQQDLQVINNPKKMKNKGTENHVPSDNISVLNEEFQKKILENAQLVSSMADKDLELNEYKERVSWLEKKLEHFEKDFQDKENKYVMEVAKLKKNNLEIEKKMGDMQNMDFLNSHVILNKANEDAEELSYWKGEADRWRSECEVLRSKPESGGQLTDYYESQLREILEAKQLAQSENKTLWGENQALYARLDNLILVNKEIEGNLERSNEELATTTENYKSQLDAMTEHLAAQNDKITKQCDQIQALKHRIASKK